MSRTSTIEFSVVPLEQDRPRVVQVMPVVDGQPFADVVAAFEDEHGYDPGGGYAGIVPGHVDLGPLDRYLLGEGEAFTDHGVIDVLGCGCGEWGCWPLAASITAHGETVTWSHFSQPHRPDREYPEFGPFTFGAAEYRAAARRAMEVLATATEV